MLDPITPERFDGLPVEALSDTVHAIISDELEKLAPV
jgi:hypothetical protein